MTDPVAQTVLGCIPAGRPVTLAEIVSRWPMGAPYQTPRRIAQYLGRLARQGRVAKTPASSIRPAIYERTGHAESA